MFVDTYFCYCCLSTEELCSIYSKTSEDNYAELLKTLLNVRLCQENNQDDYICKICIGHLKLFNEFKTRVLKSIETLEVVGVINLQKINGEIFVEKKKDCVEEKDHTKENADDTEDIKPTHTITTQTNKAKIEVEVTQNTDIIQDFLTNDSALDKDKTKSPSGVKEGDKHKASASALKAELNGEIECNVCGEKLKNIYNFNVHINKHFPNHICEICGKGFLTEQRLRRHRSSHDAGPFVCQHCGRAFYNYNTYSAHTARKHSKKLAYKCPHCELRFASIEARARHGAGAHGLPPAHACHECGSAFYTAGLLSSHIKYKHERLKKHACARCDARFFTKQDLEGHAASHTGVNRFSCDLCEKSYPRKKALTVHMKTHTDEKRFGCDICERRFIQKCSLLRHMKIHSRVKRRGHPKANNAEKNKLIDNIKKDYNLK